MSRYTVDTGFDIGWDAPFGEFFCQRFDEEDTAVDEFSSPHLSPVLDWLTQQGIFVPPGVVRDILDDSAQPWEPGPLQKKLGFTGKP